MREIFSRFLPFIEVVFYETPYGWQPGEKGEDEWGCVWRKTDGVPDTTVIKNPLRNWELMDEFDFPDAFAKGRFVEATKNMSLTKQKKKLYVAAQYNRLLNCNGRSENTWE